MKNPFNVKFLRTRNAEGNPVYTTYLSIYTGDSVSIATVITGAGGSTPDAVVEIKRRHHNQLVGILSNQLRKTLKLD